MRISDWSSDVCSSDLPHSPWQLTNGWRLNAETHSDLSFRSSAGEPLQVDVHFGRDGLRLALPGGEVARSVERRVGKEGVSTCRSRWSPYHEKKKYSIVTRYHANISSYITHTKQ